MSGPQPKRQKTYQDQRDDNYQKTPPSHVVHARSLPEQAREPEIVAALQRYGTINTIIVMPKKRQALIEFDDISSAVNCVNDAARSQIFICNHQAYLNYSSHQKIVKQQGEGNRDQSNVLNFNISNAVYPITVDVMHKICSPFGKILRIVISKKNGVQAMVEFDDLKGAMDAKEELNGADIYTDCCTIQVEFSKIPKLNVFKNDQNSWDYENDPEDSSTKRRGGDFGSSSGGGGGNKYSMGRDRDRDSRDRDNRSSSNGGSNSYKTSSSSSNGSHTNQLILMINNLDLENFNCDRLFNLLCLYGNVDRIKFLLTKEGSAMSQMNSAEPLLNVLPLVNNTVIFGKKIHIHKSNQDELKPVSKPGELPDHTASYKEYTNNRNNRYTTVEAAQKNKPIAPTNVLYWFNTPPGFDEDQLYEIFRKSGAKLPNKVKVFQKKGQDQNQGPSNEKSSTGLAEWSNITDSVEALILANHTEIEHPSSKFPYIFKLCFSAQPIADIPYHGNGNGAANGSQ